MINDCIYYVYAKYCDKDCAKEKQEYGYSDLTEHICKYRDCQVKCENYFAKINNSGKPNNYNK